MPKEKGGNNVCDIYSFKTPSRQRHPEYLGIKPNLHMENTLKTDRKLLVQI